MVEAQRLADEARVMFGGPPVRVVVSDALPMHAGAQYRDGMLVIAPAIADSPYFLPLVAHELGHATLGHVHRAAGREDAARQELDANARAVEILRGVRGLTDRAAAASMGAYLATLVRTNAVMPDGHPPACAQLRDLQRRYPGDWVKGLACVERR